MTDTPRLASLDPTDFRHEMQDRVGFIQISQVDHGLQVRSVSELHVPCACGRPLVGLETEWLHAPQGSALYYLGVCLTCGNQRGIYMSEPRTQQISEKDARIALAISDLIQRVAELREGDPTVLVAIPNDTLAPEAA